MKYDNFNGLNQGRLCRCGKPEDHCIVDDGEKVPLCDDCFKRMYQDDFYECAFCGPDGTSYNGDHETICRHCGGEHIIKREVIPCGIVK